MSVKKSGLLKIIESNKTWRCNSAIAEFSDAIFDASWGFPKTESLNGTLTGHDGVYLLKVENVDRYIEKFQPQCLRDSANSGKSFNLDFLNFRMSKGMTFERTLIVLTAGIEAFVQNGSNLEPLAASKIYVAVTRASQSVALVIQDAGDSRLPFWNPN